GHLAPRPRPRHAEPPPGAPHVLPVHLDHAPECATRGRRYPVTACGSSKPKVTGVCHHRPTEHGQHGHVVRTAETPVMKGARCTPPIDFEDLPTRSHPCSDVVKHVLRVHARPKKAP